MPRAAQFFRLFSLAAAIPCSLSQSSPGQSHPTSPPPAAAPPSASATSQPAATIKANAQLVIVDVVATDNDQKPIHGLKATDFAIMEAGSVQKITGFEEHIAPTQPVQAQAIHPLPPGIFTNFAPAPTSSAVNVLLIDVLNTPMKDQMVVRDQLLEFLKNTPAGTRIAIFGLNDRLSMLQGFTSDLTMLRAAVDKMRPGSSKMLPDNVGSGAGEPVSQQVTDAMGDAPDMFQLITMLQQFEAQQASTDSQIRAQATLDAMNQIAHYLAGIPGRKNLIWFSGSFPISILPDTTGIAHPFSVVAGSQDEFQQTVTLLARAQVAVYPIDARGLQTEAHPISDSPPAAALSGAGYLASKIKFTETNTSEHGTMNMMAEQTGGQAYVDTNGLSAAVGKAIENGSNYYTLSYTPTNQRQDGEFRKIQIKAERAGIDLSYRNGYFADDPNPKHAANFAGATSGPPTPFVKAMLRGAPNATEILLKLQVLPTTATPEDKIAPANSLSPNPTVKSEVKGPYRRYSIDIAANPRDIRITATPDHRYRFAAQIVTFVYDTNGNLVNTAVQNAQGNLTPSTYANMLRTGLPFHQEVSVPVKGNFYLRTSVHDVETDRLGSVEIPVTTVANLAPLTSATTVAPR
jgi:VWFA-related protein